MKRLSNQPRAFVRGIFCVLIILLGVSILQIINTRSTINSSDFQVSFSLTPHDPISILCDSDFGPSKYNFPGSGVEKDPYIITGYRITSTLSSGIHISDTTKYFIIRNCHVNTNCSGIYIGDVADGTAIVINNICNNNNIGISLDNSDFCILSYNLLQENENYGVHLFSNSDNNIIHHNTFVDNNLGGTSQAFNYGSANTWYDVETLEGNWWSDWSGTGSYSIDGPSGSIDPYPLNESVIDNDSPLIVDITHSPSTPSELDTITINATVTDASGVQSVTLHYRINGGVWIEVNMTHISGDLYSVIIGSFSISDTIEYYVSAVDNSTNHNEAINDNSGLYYSFTVSVVIPEFQLLSLLLPMITSLFLVFGLVVLQRRRK
ncbi:MAG: right-handed parallel beta-helix repeat-containing protein [Candidatus Heimdallarchaeota archaeon]|nr:right-handed parallel beta-helix repeat-containing protein [Candidatus Heimdallarchaeota archaeon]MCK4254130.1 right-handed parallel beta-helix repeat-containing protein [Candidatus Heimdallarchaeota archaeon]